MKLAHLISELKELLGDYWRYSARNGTQYGSRNLVCVAIEGNTASSDSVLPSAATVVGVLRDLVGLNTPVLPDLSSKADETHQINHLLGNEYTAVIVDGSAGWPTNTLGAAAGAVQYPGTLFLLLPDGLTVSASPTAYEVYLKRELNTQLAVHPQNALLAALLPWRDARTNPATPHTESLQVKTPVAPRAWHADQQAVINSLLQRLRTNERTVDVLIAKRGRGKSASLGLLINDLEALEGSLSLTLTASHSAQVTSVIKHVTVPSISYTALDAAMASSGDVLIIDEAGSVPLPVLCVLIRGFTHTILASTTDGYEGSARALVTRFSELSPSELLLSKPVQFHQLQQPIRWPASDSLEPAVTALLQLDADKNKQMPNGGRSTEGICASELTHAQITSSDLLNDPTLLKTTFGLLMQAHYQTTSRDLQHLLDQEGLRLYVQQLSGTLTSACLLVNEGALTDASQTEITSGRRRPKHQRLPMLLHRQASSDIALQTQYWRIIRIAVQPDFQRRGYGTAMLNHILKSAQITPAKERPHFIGASFGATASRIQFWSEAGFQPFQWGFRLNPRSGTRTVSVLKAIHYDDTQAYEANNLLEKASAVFHDAVQSFLSLYQKDVAWLHELYGPLPVDTDLLNVLSQRTQRCTPRFSVDDQTRLAMWQDNRLSLHEVWGPLIRALGGEQAVMQLSLSSHLSAKQITKALKGQLAKDRDERF